MQGITATEAEQNANSFITEYDHFIDINNSQYPQALTENLDPFIQDNQE